MIFSENDIRPHDLDAGKLEALDKDLNWLREREHLFVQVNCPACCGNHKQLAFAKYGFSFVRCVDCGTAYMNPRANADLLAEFYGRSVLYAYWNAYIFPASKEARRQHIFAPRAKAIADKCRIHNVNPGLLVDVGAATGLFCEEVVKLDLFRRVVAVEPGTALAESCVNAGIETVNLPIESIEDFGEQASVVTSFETIEHLCNPEQMLRRCGTFLRKGGLLVLSCPSYAGFDIQTLGILSDSLDAEHINLFTPSSLNLLVRRCGFSVLECTTPGKLDAELVRNKALANEISLKDQPFLQTVLLDRWQDLGQSFQNFLVDSQLSSHMWMVAQKP